MPSKYEQFDEIDAKLSEESWEARGAFTDAADDTTRYLHFLRFQKIEDRRAQLQCDAEIAEELEHEDI